MTMKLVRPESVSEQQTKTTLDTVELTAGMLQVTEFLTTGPAARAAGVSESTVRLWCAQGRLSAQRTQSGLRLYRLEDVLRVAAERAAR